MQEAKTSELLTALDEVAKSDVNKRKIIIEASEENEDDPERKKPHLSTSEDDQNPDHVSDETRIKS